MNTEEEKYLRQWIGDFLEPSLEELETMISVVKNIRELTLGKLKL
jgi:hypothetical protein